jgi:hypothetical protein
MLAYKELVDEIRKYMTVFHEAVEITASSRFSLPVSKYSALNSLELFREALAAELVKLQAHGSDDAQRLAESGAILHQQVGEMLARFTPPIQRLDEFCCSTTNIIGIKMQYLPKEVPALLDCLAFDVIEGKLSAKEAIVKLRLTIESISLSHNNRRFAEILVELDVLELSLILNTG